MKKFFIAVFAMILAISLTACGGDTSTHIEVENNSEGPQLSFVAEFYDNHGSQWLSVEGTSFDIEPNKVKEYSYDSDGSWISQWAMSSVMSVDIDGHSIESCGSTILFYDTRLKPLDMEIPQDVTLSQGNSADMSIPSDLRYGDAWHLSWWWNSKNIQNNEIGSKIVIIQSQEGDSICMFGGDNVSWDVSRNLPKTTEVNIDGYMLYIHRANFAIVDTEIFE